MTSSFWALCVVVPTLYEIWWSHWEMRTSIVGTMWFIFVVSSYALKPLSYSQWRAWHTRALRGFSHLSFYQKRQAWIRRYDFLLKSLPGSDVLANDLAHFQAFSYTVYWFTNVLLQLFTSIAILFALYSSRWSLFVTVIALCDLIFKCVQVLLSG